MLHWRWRSRTRDGQVSSCNHKDGYRYKNSFRIVTKRLTVQGFLVLKSDQELQERFMKDVQEWLCC